MGAGVLRLEVREFRSLTRWRWVLLDAGGSFIADHEVRLDATAWQYEAFGDLRGYLRWHCAPDRRAEDEARIVSEVGAWIGSRVLGPVAAALVKRRPATVRVVVPAQAAELLYRPLELAHANAKPLAVQDVTLVMESGTKAARIEPVGERLRVLGLFSLPEGGRSLNLRRERAELVRLVRGIAATGKAADVRVLQYGVTRDRLGDVLAEAEGWDIIHVSGHGSPGSLTLETASGSPDRVTAADLVGLLDPARERLKLVTMSACWSAAVLADEQRRLLGLPARDQDQGDSAERDRGDSSPSTSSGGLASELADQLGCAILAMRYPVGDDFAIALSGKLYGLLAEKGQPLPRAVGMTLRELSTATDGTGLTGSGAGSGAFPALSMGTPALFGGMAVDLRLAAPSRSGPASYDTAQLKMAGFPPEPPRFVGRTAVLARSSAALAPRSGVPGVLLHGMPGGGKSACAVELAYGHEEIFDRLVWYKAPDEGMAIDGALTDFALTLERYLPNFQMAHVLVSAETLAGFLPRLTELLEQRRLLIVIDNVESLLSEAGAWRDDRWGLVLGALTGHSGLGRVILTSRRLPAGPLPGLRVEPVDALSADEALLLARELPNLSALKLGAVPGIGPTVSKQLARNAIAMAQGHPKLLELAEGQAANPDHLLELVKTGDQTWRKLGGVPDGFFASDRGPTATDDDYLQVIAAWTKAVTDTLMPGERDLFWFLCCLEEGDRERHMLDGNWSDLWTRLGREGLPPDWERILVPLVDVGLTTIREGTRTYYQSYLIHPGVAAAGRALAGQRFQEAVDEEAVAYWGANFQQASGEGDAAGNVLTDILVRAGLAVTPYLIRQQRWTAAALALDTVFLRNPTRSNAAGVLPVIRQVVAYDPSQASVLGRVLEVVDPAGAESNMRASLEAHVRDGDYWAASAVASQLLYHNLNGGQLAKALAFADEAMTLAGQAGFGPWTRLLGEIQRLQVLNAMGQAERVLAEVLRLREHALTLPAALTKDDPVPIWDVREKLLDTGRSAARQLGRWDNALELTTDIVKSMHTRPPAFEIAKAAFNCHLPLLRLGRTSEALALLKECRDEFQQANDVRCLGMAMTALAEAEDQRGHGEMAITQVLGGLRYTYMANDLVSIAVSYNKLGGYLHAYTRNINRALACLLAAAVILELIGAAGSTEAISDVATVFQQFDAETVPPRDVMGLCSQVGDIPGTDLRTLITKLSPNPQVAEQALRDLIAHAQELTSDQPGQE